MDGSEQNKPLKVKRFFKKVRGFRRFLLFFGIWFFIVLIVLSISAEITSRPSFCPTCHYMEPFYQSWRTSSHNKVDCVECHFEPGMTGTIKGKVNGLVQIVNYVSLSYKKRKPWADIPDNTCVRSGCHVTQAFQDTTYDFSGIAFNHKHHLSEQRRGKTLKCTSCHSQIVQGTHMEVTTATCFNCHFHKSDDPEHKWDVLTECSKCHDWQNKSREQLANLRYNHTTVVDNKIECSSCHNKVISGTGEVGKERCFQCHFESERLDKYDDTEFMHSSHIAKHSMSCMTCHSPIKHRIEPIDPKSPPECSSCHEDAHTSMVSLYTGENGYNVDKTPSVMYLSGINCKGCHTFHETDKMSVSTLKAEKNACDKCHGKGYGNLIKQWQEASVKRVATIKAIYNTAKTLVASSNSSNRKDAVRKLEEALHNIKIVETGKNVHNVQFSEKLLLGSYGLMNQALSIIGSGKKLPDFKSDTEYIPNECYNCHSGIQEISRKVFGMNFSHNQHMIKQRIACNKCHSNATRHGELIMNKENCNSCHHSGGKTGDACGKCHEFQVQVYNGNYLNKNQPDIMKAGGVNCNDCHVSSDEVIKPDTKICLKCHEEGYDEMMNDWKKDVGELIEAVKSKIRNINTAELNAEQKSQLEDARNTLNKISSYPSIYVHNYDLISTILTEKKKALYNMEK